MTADQRRWKLRPECRGAAQEAIAQMRALGLRVELQRGDWLVFELEHLVIDQQALEILDRVWPRWRDCVSE
jgi:hypothetical protein